MIIIIMIIINTIVFVPRSTNGGSGDNAIESILKCLKLEPTYSN